jgi:hypothetical protein
LGQIYVQSKGHLDFMPNSAAGLVADVERWLNANRMHHRLDEKARIASEAFRIAQQVRQQQAPEAETATLLDVQQGYGDRRHDLDELAMTRMSELALSAQVAQMDMQTYSENRARLGVEQDLASFLGGRD